MPYSYRFTVKKPLCSLQTAFTLRIIECWFMLDISFNCLAYFSLTFLSKDSSPNSLPWSCGIAPWNYSMKSCSLRACQSHFNGDVHIPVDSHYPIKQYSQLPTSTARSGHLNYGYVDSRIVVGRLILIFSTLRRQCSKWDSHWELWGRSRGECESRGDGCQLVDGWAHHRSSPRKKQISFWTCIGVNFERQLWASKAQLEEFQASKTPKVNAAC